MLSEKEDAEKASKTQFETKLQDDSGIKVESSEELQISHLRIYQTQGTPQRHLLLW